MGVGGRTLRHGGGDGHDDLIVQVEGTSPVEAHQQVRVSADGAACHLFDGAGLALPRLARHQLVA